MLIVHVHVHLKPEFIEQFRLASLQNARSSVEEPGIARFDVLQQADDPARFVLVEVYRDAGAPDAHDVGVGDVDGAHEISRHWV